MVYWKKGEAKMSQEFYMIAGLAVIILPMLIMGVVLLKIDKGKFY